MRVGGSASSVSSLPPHAGQNARAALERIGGESLVNAIRVKRYGIGTGPDA